ncbi:hypothetical protein BJX96DRAFT_156797 [Aspergillus floccosus]
MVQVRCSGERTGCARCLSLGYSCVYSESRVGKVQGNRARRRPTESSREPPRGLPTPDPSRTLEATPTSTPDPRERLGTTPNSMDGHAMADGEHSTFYEDYLHEAGMADCSLLVGFDDFPCSDSSLGPLMQTDANSRANDIDHYGLPSHPSGNVIPGSSPLHLDGPLETAPPPSRSSWEGSSDGKHSGQPYKHPTSLRMVDCVWQVYSLEQHIHTRLVAPDEVMRVNKQCVLHILSLLEYEETSPSMSLLGLCCLLLNHVVTLFDAGWGHRCGLDNRPEHANSRMPPIRFGNFRVDPEEHLAIQGQIFLREVQRSQRAAEKLIGRLQLVRDDRGNLGSIYSSWVKDMQSRLELLCETIAK